ncbi:MAG: hypothetical protein R3211_09520 [Balneolaceae bacterium]|nr:hypothetical protein [Balneolaceae bacterium]
MQTDNALLILRIFHASMVLFLISFGGVILYLQQFVDINPILMFNEWIRYSILLIIVVIIWFSNRIYKNRLLYAAGREELVTKLNHYRMAYIFRMSLVELSAIIPLIGYFVTGRIIFFIYAVVPFIYLLFIFPTIGKVLNDLELSADESHRLENKLNSQ